MQNLGAELRAYRSRTGIKQEALAAQLQISQAFVSRLEAGRIEPGSKILLRIRNLLDNPGNRPVLDHVLTSVRRSPHVICVIQPQGDNMRYVALSEGFINHPQFAPTAEGQVFRKQASEDGARLVSSIIDSGAFDGDVESIDVMWKAEIDGFENYWCSINTPIRAGENDWYLHCAMNQIEAGEFAHRLEARDGRLLIVRRFQ